MWWVPLMAAAVEAGSSAYQARENRKESSRNRGFQERMSSTSYQRAAADLEAAGLNRVLALGDGASTPAGAQAHIEKPDLVNSGILASSAKQSIAQSKAEEKLIEQREKESASSEDLNRAAAITSATQAQLNVANSASAVEQAKVLSEQAAKVNAEAAKVRAETKKVDMWNPVRDVVHDVLEFLEGKLRSGARESNRDWWPKIKDTFKDDPDSGWYDNFRKRHGERKSQWLNK